MRPYTEEQQIALITAIANGRITDSIQAAEQGFAPADRQVEKARFKQELMDSAHAAANGNFLITIGGGQLSGKTAARHLLLDTLRDANIGTEQLLVINNMQFKELLPEYRAIKSIPDNVRESLLRHIPAEKLREIQEQAFPFIRKEADDLKLELVIGGYKKGVPIFVEDQMSNPDLYEKMTKATPDYLKVLIAPHITPEKIFERGPRRQAASGRRFLPQEFLTAHRDFERNMDAYEKMYDIVIRLDNNFDLSKGGKPFLFAATVHGNRKILNEESYEQARRKRDINVNARGPEEIYTHGIGAGKIPGLAEQRLEGSGTESGRGGSGGLEKDGMNAAVELALMSAVERLKAERDSEPEPSGRQRGGG